MDYHSLARQHVITGDSSSNSDGGGSLAATKRQPLVLRATSTIFQVGLLRGCCGGTAASNPCMM